MNLCKVVTILVKDASNQESITGGLTDNEGRFSISGLTDGNYIITCSFVGYESTDIPLLIGNNPA